MSKTQEKKCCLVTGVAGFVGSHLAERLLELDCQVVGVDNFFSGYRRNMAGFEGHPDFCFYERSITDPDLLDQLCSAHPRLKYCFNLAAVVSVPYSVDHPEQTMEINYRAVLDLLNAARKQNFAAFVFAGSAAEYGDDQRLPLQESYADLSTRFASPYGKAKFLASQAVAAAPCGVALRCFNIFGPRQDPTSPYSGVISRFVDRTHAGKALTIYGDGRQTRDFIYVADVVEAYLAAAGLKIPSFPLSPGVYNIGTGQSVSVLELATVIQDLAGSRKPMEFLPERQGDIRHSCADIRAFQQATGWKPRVSLREGLKKLLKGIS